MKSFQLIRNKVLAVVLLTTFCALLVTGGTLLIYDINSYRSDLINDMTIQADLLGFSTAPALQFENQTVAADNLNLLQNRPSVRGAAIYNARGNIFAQYTRANVSFTFPGLPSDDSVLIENGTLSIFKRIIENGEILGTAYLQSDYQLIERILNFARVLFLVAIGAMLIAVLLSLWLQSIITRPVESIVGVARNVIANKDYSMRATKTTEDEIGLLVDAFNEMLERIETRTSELESFNARLEQESAERKKAREEVLRLNHELENKVVLRTQELQQINQELESFCYSVSHDLRAPLRAISGFTQALNEELSTELSSDANRYMNKIIAAAGRMGQLIEDLLNLSRVSRTELVRDKVELSKIAYEVINSLQHEYPDHQVTYSVWDDIIVEADAKLIRILLENLLGNSWKFTGNTQSPKVDLGLMKDENRDVVFIRDNGAGFDMKYANKLFGPFQRLHGMDEFPGTGIGLATVQRIIQRHGGKIWFDSAPGKGAVFYFTLQIKSTTQAVDPFEVKDQIISNAKK